MLLVSIAVEVTNGSNQLLTKQNTRFILWYTLHKVCEQSAQLGTQKRLGMFTHHPQNLHLDHTKDVQHRGAAYEQTQAAVDVLYDGRVSVVQLLISLLEQTEHKVFAEKMLELLAMEACVRFENLGANLLLESIFTKQDEAGGERKQRLALLLCHLFLCCFHYLFHNGSLDWNGVIGAHEAL